MPLQSLVDTAATPERVSSPPPARQIVNTNSKLEPELRKAAKMPSVSTMATNKSAGCLPEDLKSRLRALSALQLRYGRPHEAVPYLALLKWDQPNDVETSRLLALTLMRLGKFKEAEAMLSDVRLPVSSPLTGPMALYRAVVSMKLGAAEKARQWLARFRVASLEGDA